MTSDVLLVEDNCGDVRLTKEVFRDANERIRLHFVSDGVEAMAFLRREGDHFEVPRPDLILLDLNMPKMSGYDLLAQIKNDDGLKSIPTIILTTSNAERDINRCYQLHANCVVTKPMCFEEFEALMKSISDFWLSRAKLPRQRVIT
jgi:chemotaxis family two-component system response regulator Rcp1